MAITDIKNSMSGIFANPAMIIEAADYITSTANLIESTWSVMPGTVAQGTENGQVLMETQWFSPGVIANNTLLTLRFNATSGVNFEDFMEVDIARREPNSNDITVTMLKIPYVSYISPYGGTTNIDTTFDRLCTEFLYFDAQYEYKFIARIGNYSGSDSIQLKHLKLTEIFPTTLNSPRQYSLGTNGTYIPIIEGIYWTATTDGSGNLNYDIPLETEATYDSGVRGEYHEVDAVITGFVSNTDTSVALASIATYDAVTGRNTINVKLSGYAINTLVYFYTIVYGFRRPLAV